MATRNYQGDNGCGCLWILFIIAISGGGFFLLPRGQYNLYRVVAAEVREAKDSIGQRLHILSLYTRMRHTKDDRPEERYKLDLGFRSISKMREFSQAVGFKYLTVSEEKGETKGKKEFENGPDGEYYIKARIDPGVVTPIDPARLSKSSHTPGGKFFDLDAMIRELEDKAVYSGREEWGAGKRP